VKSLLSGGNYPVALLHGCGPGYPSIISKSLAYNFRGISRMFSRVWCCNASLNENSFVRDITCN